jgi:hypothetical protein
MGLAERRGDLANGRGELTVDRADRALRVGPGRFQDFFA